MKYGLIGEHLPHSYSKIIHELLGEYTYDLHPLAPEELDGFMCRRAFDAINVTIPYKQAVIPYLDYVDPQAQAIGAVNTVVNRQGKLWGYNTDFYGLQELITATAGPLEGKHVMILGTGGTGLTACAVAKAMGAKQITVVSRHPEKDQVDYPTAQKDGSVQILINTTPVGMYPQSNACPIDLEEMTGLEAVVDAVYNPLRTKLICRAQEKGLKAQGGLYMLVAQALEAYRHFTGKTAPNSAQQTILTQLRTQKQNIVLTGMPASGKSTVGWLIAKATGRPFWDTDQLIQETFGQSIPQIFAQEGEEGFRHKESQVIARLAAEQTGCVIATGGGAILRRENVEALKQTGRLYFIDRPLEALLPTKDRPLASTAQDIRRRYRERYGLYCATCDLHVKSDNVAEHTAQTIRKDFFA